MRVPVRRRVRIDRHAADWIDDAVLGLAGICGGMVGVRMLGHGRIPAGGRLILIPYGGI
jgi:hypothetical protein